MLKCGPIGSYDQNQALQTHVGKKRPETARSATELARTNLISVRPSYSRISSTVITYERVRDMVAWFSDHRRADLLHSCDKSSAHGSQTVHLHGFIALCYASGRLCERIFQEITQSHEINEEGTGDPHSETLKQTDSSSLFKACRRCSQESARRSAGSPLP